MTQHDDDLRKIEHVHFVASRSVWTVLGFAGCLIFAGFTWWMTTVNSEQQTIRREVREVEVARRNDATRIEVLASEIRSVQSSQSRIESSLKDVNEKLDRVIERGSH